LLKKLRNGKETQLAGDVWDIARLYDVFVFRKHGGSAQRQLNAASPPGDYLVEEADIINVQDEEEEDAKEPPRPEDKA